LVASNPGSFNIWGYALRENFTNVATGFMLVNDEETVVGLLKKGAPQYQMQFSAYVALNEVLTIVRKPLIPALNDFASTAKAIIKLFDTGTTRRASR
jgi:hypothetical protein